VLLEKEEEKFLEEPEGFNGNNSTKTELTFF
jgi:hypothetical protein